jgi:hypothetical protein
MSDLMDVTGNAPRSTPAAARMRAHRQRRKSGLICVTIELRETEVTELIRRKLLEADARHDLHAIRNALHRHLDESLRAWVWRVTDDEGAPIRKSCAAPIYSGKYRRNMSKWPGYTLKIKESSDRNNAATSTQSISLNYAIAACGL